MSEFCVNFLMIYLRQFSRVLLTFGMYSNVVHVCLTSFAV